MNLDSSYAEVALLAAQRAGQLLMEGFRTHVTVKNKGDIDLVTEYDVKAEAVIREVLVKAFPEHRIVGEEGTDIGTGSLVWYVDPVDGTTNFAHGHPFFAVSIALYEGGEPVVGVVHAPALNVTWSSTRGAGSTRNGQPCSVSSRDRIGKAFCATGFPYDQWTNPDNNHTEFSAFMKRTQGVRRGGSASIDLAMLADGTFDIYWEQRLKPWDVAAGFALVREAGGVITTYDGAPADPHSETMVVTNGLLHPVALDVLFKVRSQLVKQAFAEQLEDKSRS